MKNKNTIIATTIATGQVSSFNIQSKLAEGENRKNLQ